MIPSCSAACTEAHPQRAHYYVSVVRDDGARAIICGPYPTHAAALADVELARDRVCDFAPETWWLAWGTCGSDDLLRARWVDAPSIFV